jgi:hypothetical protein
MSVTDILDGEDDCVIVSLDHGEVIICVLELAKLIHANGRGCIIQSLLVNEDCNLSILP